MTSHKLNKFNFTLKQLIIIILGVSFLCFLAITTSGCNRKTAANRIPGVAKFRGQIPQGEILPGMKQIGKVKFYRNKEVENAIGSDAKQAVNLGLVNLAITEYTLGDDLDRSLTIETYVMETSIQALALYHHYRGWKLKDTGEPVEVGNEGVLDVKSEGRNLYFVKGVQFFKIIYSGVPPLPDLIPLGVAIADGTAGAEDKRERGFDHINIDGITVESATVSPGFLFGYEFFPPGVTARAPGAGENAIVFIINHNSLEDAERTAQQYRIYIERRGKDYDSRTVDRKNAAYKRLEWWGRDPLQGRVVCTQINNWVVGVLRADSLQQGQDMLEKIAAKIRKR